MAVSATVKILQKDHCKNSAKWLDHTNYGRRLLRKT